MIHRKSARARLFRTHNPLVLGSNPSGPTNKFLSPAFAISWFSRFVHFRQIRGHSRTKLPRPAPQPLSVGPLRWKCRGNGSLEAAGTEAGTCTSVRRTNQGFGAPV